MKEIAAFRALASADRQFLLHELVRTDGKASEEELSRQVAARRHQLAPETINEETIDRAHLRLVHVHFPLLRDLDIIECDEGTVALTDECRDHLLEAAEMLEEWPPDDRLQHPPS